MARRRRPHIPAPEPLRVGDVITVVADALPLSADTRCRIVTESKAPLPSNAQTIWVSGLLPGERARVRVIAARANSAQAVTEQRFTSAAERVAPFCPIFERCGGCQRQHVRDDARLAYKRDALIAILGEHIGADGADLASIVEPFPTAGPTASRARRYRLKIGLSVTGTSPELLAVGFHAARSADIIRIEDCPVQDELGTRLALDLAQAARAAGVRPYIAPHRAPRPDLADSGDLKHIVVRVGAGTGERAVVLVARDVAFTGRDALVEAAMSHPTAPAVSVSVNAHARPGSALMTDHMQLLAGVPRYRAVVNGLSYHVSPRSFFQVAAHTAEGIVASVNEFVTQAVGSATADLPLAGLRVLECYAGVGLIGLALARLGATVHAIERVADACEDARVSAQLAGLSERFVVHEGDVETSIDDAVAAVGAPFDVVVHDPPRAGTPAGVIQQLRALSPRAIVHVSCDGDALGRDVHALSARSAPVPPAESAPGYRLARVRPLDGFPHAYGLESVALLLRN